MPSRFISPWLAAFAHGERDDMRRAEPVKGEIQRGNRRFLGIALPPGALAQPPADFQLAREIGTARRIDPLQPAKTEQLTILLALDQPEGVAKFALIADQPLKCRVPGSPVLNTAKLPHDRRRVHDR